MSRPNFLSPGLVESGGRLSKQLADFLTGLADGTTDPATAAALTEVVERLVALENADLSIVGMDGITVYGDEDSGFQVVLDASVLTAIAAASSGVPTLIASGVTYTVAANTQALFAYPITVDGLLVVDGVLVEVT